MTASPDRPTGERPSQSNLASVSSVETQVRDQSVVQDAVAVRKVQRIVAGAGAFFDDDVAVEEPMQTNVVWTKRGRKIERPVAVTMRTPGRDADLAVGFLVAEGVISDFDHVESVTASDNQTTVQFRPGHVVELCDLHRRGTTTSACGVCGKTTIDQIRVKTHRPLMWAEPTIHSDRLRRLPDQLRRHQPIFERTGGIHACGVFTVEGDWISGAEDVGRHNALDKLIGEATRSGELDGLSQSALVLSGRVSFELVQKSLVVGIPIIVSVGAPSSLAIETAEAFDQTLVGFASKGRINVYTGSKRVVV